LENYGYAISDAEEAIKLDPSFLKAYYRRASAYMALGKFKESLKDFRSVVKYAPNDPDAKAKLQQVR
jgi:serine/threonine-protein phosphatase 5